GEFQAVVLRAVAARQDDRHGSVAALRADLTGLLRDLRRDAPRRRRLLPRLALSAMVLVLLAGTGLLLYNLNLNLRDGGALPRRLLSRLLPSQTRPGPQPAPQPKAPVPAPPA